MSPGLLPFLLWPISHRDPLSPTIRLIFAGVFVALTAAVSWNWRRIARDGIGDRDRLAAVYGYAGSVLLTIFLFPAHAECGLALLGVLAFGDGAATLFGKLLGGPRLPWNPAKSVAGLCGFLLVGIPVTALIYWGESHNLEAGGPPARWGQAFLIAAAGVAAGALAESVRSRINDNIRVGFAAAAALLAAHAALFGLSP
jgi:dolichol kinase